MSDNGNPFGKTVAYAGLGARILASLIDYAVLAAFAALPLIRRVAVVGYEEAAWEHLAWVAAIGWPYFAYAEASSWQGTPGKKLLGLRVCDLDGYQIGLERAAVRYLLKIAFLVIGFQLISPFTVAFASHKQALHDLVARTCVLGAAPLSRSPTTLDRYQSYSDVPWYRRSKINTIFVILSVFGLPFWISTIAMLLTGDIYFETRDEKGALRVWSHANKLLAIYLALWLLFLAYLFVFAREWFRAILAI